MGFYDLSKSERSRLAQTISSRLLDDLKSRSADVIITYFNDADTYVRKTAYVAIGRIYFRHKTLRHFVVDLLNSLSSHENFHVRQSSINAAGEIGKVDFEKVQPVFDKGLFDEHHAPRNAVIGSIKKMGEVNPEPVLAWAKKYLHHPEKEIRREICHGIELRGRKFPEDVLPLLKELQHDKTSRVRSTLVHVIGQIAYKKGCLATVIGHLKTWENTKLVEEAIDEIIDVHDRYRNFAALTQEEAVQFIKENYPGK